MKVQIITAGDRSVGIMQGEMTIEFNVEFSDSERPMLREIITEFTQEIFDEKPKFIVFEDECGDCGRKIEICKGKCMDIFKENDCL